MHLGRALRQITVEPVFAVTPVTPTTTPESSTEKPDSEAVSGSKTVEPVFSGTVNAALVGSQ